MSNIFDSVMALCACGTRFWPRDKHEPAEWTIEAVDKTPNTQGSPGLFGNANAAEISIDNISVKANDAAEKK